MTRPPTADLFQPSLSRNASAAPLHPFGAVFFVAFFGGPLALVVIGALNSRRLGRLSHDAYVYVLAVAGTVGLTTVSVAFPDLLASISVGEDPKTTLRLAFRAFSLGLAGLLWLQHRRHYRAMRTMGLHAPTPWIAAILCVLAGIVLTFALALGTGAVLALTMPDGGPA